MNPEDGTAEPSRQQSHLDLLFELVGRIRVRVPIAGDQSPDGYIPSTGVELMLHDDELIEQCVALSADVRSVAVYQHGALCMRERPGLVNSSAAESDRYEELIVNPTAVTPYRQRGDIDCGGLRYLLIRYGNFFQFVRPVPGGHVSVGLEASSDVAELAAMLDTRLPVLAGEPIDPS